MMYRPKPYNPRVNRELSITKGLVLAPPFYEYGRNIIKDLSGYHNDGLIAGGVTYVNSLFGHSLNFNGTSGSIDIPDSPSFDMGSAMTMNLLLKPTLSGGTGNRTMGQWHGGSDSSWHLYFANSGVIQFFCSSDGSAYYYEQADTFTLSANVDQLVTITYKGGDAVKIYVNADLKASTGYGTESLPSSLHNSSLQMRIGRTDNSPMTNFWYTGLMDGVYLYNRALSHTEILKLYEDVFYSYRTTPRRYFIAASLVVGKILNKQQYGQNLGQNIGMQ